MSFSYRRTVLRSPRSRRKRFRLTSFLFATLALLALFSLLGPPWLIQSLEKHASHPFFFAGLSAPVREDPTKYSGKRIRKLEKKVAAQVKSASKVRSCRRYEREGDQAVFGNKCKEKLHLMDARQRSIVVYNPAPYVRFWCGIKVPGKHVLSLTESESKELCKEPPRMLERKPTIDGADMPAIQLTASGGEFFGDVDMPAERFPCDIPCEHASWEGDVIQYYKVKDTDLSITYSMESTQHYPELTIEDYAYRRNTYYATTSFRSEIPLPYFSFAEYNISSPAVEYDGAIRGASFLARNCESMSNREDVVQDLMKSTKIDSLSECLNNAEPPDVKDDGGLGGKIAIMRSYLFHLAFENSKEDDYVTEKLWGTLQAGTLPIYYGAPNVKEHAPPNSIISWHDFDSTDELAQYMNKVVNDKALYDSYHEWRTKPLPESFREKFEFTNTHSICRMCRWAYAKKYGLGWNHESQTIQNVVVPRELKYSTSGKVIKPFRESWLLPGKGAGWSRTLYEHDGVIDIHFEALPQSNSTVYRMATSMQGQFRADEFSRHVFTLQNDVSRITVVTSWDAAVENREPNAIDITLENSFDMLRVRVIMEDVDTFHKGADKVATYFGDVMANDFFTSMEAFIVEGTRAEIASAAQ